MLFVCWFSFRTMCLGVLSAGLLLCMTGCTLQTTAPDMSVPGMALVGSVYGGNQPVVGAHVYLMAATVSGVGAAGYGLASTSLLNVDFTAHFDSIGAYVLTTASGTFSITGDYTCPTPTTQVYLYALGGNPGAGTNNAASFMAALGSCGSLTSATFVQVNELTTVAAAYALAGFATDAQHVSIPQYATTATQLANTTDALAQTGLQNAFANAGNLVSVTTGAALTTTPGGNGTPATAQVITLGNILAACINSNGAITNPSNCYTLLNNAGSTGGATGTIPSETATAAINIAHYPYVSSAVLTSLYGLSTATGAPFAGGDTAQPTDFTVAINFTGGGLDQGDGLAIDGAGNVWATNVHFSSLSKFSPSGAAISPSAGYKGGGLNGPNGIAIDGTGNAWVANGSGVLAKFSNSGTAISTASGYGGGGLASGLNYPTSVALDAQGNAWALSTNNVLSELNNSGTAISPSAGYTGGGLSDASTASISVAMDSSGNVWTANSGNSTLSKFSSSGTAISPSAGYPDGTFSAPTSIAIDSAGNAWVSNTNSLGKFSSSGAAISPAGGYTGGGLHSATTVAIDGAGNAWVSNISGNSVSAFTSSGAPLSPSTGYTGGGIYAPWGLAIDGSGDVWVDNTNGQYPGPYFTLTELVGAATPVVTPIVANLIAPYSAPASRP